MRKKMNVGPVPLQKSVRLHDCLQCGAVGTVKIFAYLGRGDIVICQQCGAGYQIHSRRPFRLQEIAPYDA